MADTAPPLDLAELDRIAALLPPREASWVLDRIEPPWRRRLRLQAERDAIVCEAIALLLEAGERFPTTAASRLERLVRQHLAGADWRAGRSPPDSRSRLLDLVHRLALSLGGEPLGYRTWLRAWERAEKIRASDTNSPGGVTGNAAYHRR